MRCFVGLVALAAVVTADVYFHIPRGSNNRLNEGSANRQNANRLFDSQNNNRGGYNVGDKTKDRAGNEDQQYRMKYFQSSSAGVTSTDGRGQSYLTFEWTNQHGCGGNEETDPHKQNCNIVLQYMCQKDHATSSTGSREEDYLRNGRASNTQDYQRPGNLQENRQQYLNRRNGRVRTDRGYHEPYSWYDKCFVRERNQGLFTADQNLKNNNGLGYSSAIYTRQNPNGDRRGYECPEERDYYPYWHPTPWKDLAVLTDNTILCDGFRGQSFNVHPYHECVEHWDTSRAERKPYSRYNNQEDCEENGHAWTEFVNYLEKAPASMATAAACAAASGDGLRYIWAIPHDSVDGRSQECLVALAAPECSQADWSRVNHLGNGRDGVMNNYTWVIPHFPSQAEQRCVIRIRYNISTDDYDPFNTDSEYNGAEQSPVTNDPQVNIGASSKLQLAINTAQFGRTFQDRSHVFFLHPRPEGADDQRIYNLNVRGKRGNIVQTFPAVEYDFHPNTLSVRNGDLIHIQWTGSNSHNNGNQAGDGQKGDAGEGQSGTDRSNLVQIQDLNQNYPLPWERTTMWQEAEVVWSHHGHTDLEPQDLAINMASSGHYVCVMSTGCPEANQSAERKSINDLLNDVSASYEGALVKFSRGTYHYMCTRNNNFSNRSQKGTIIVE